MVLKSESKIYQHIEAKTMYLTIPSEIASDSQFPFKKGEIVIIEIVNDELIIKRKEKEVN